MKIPRVAAIIGPVAFAVGTDAKHNMLRGGSDQSKMERRNEDAEFHPVDIIRQDVTVEPRNVLPGADRENHMAQQQPTGETEKRSSTRERPFRRRRRRRRRRAVGSSNNALLVKGFGTDMCWKVRNSEMSAGNAIVLDVCDGNDLSQQFVKSTYSYDYETGARSWFFRPLHADLESDLYVAGHQESASGRGGSWKMVLQELKFGITQPTTQVFWTVADNSHGEGEGADIMGMGDHAYSTRLLVTNGGSTGAGRDVPVVLRTKDRIYEAEEESVGEGSIIPGLWSYVYVG